MTVVVSVRSHSSPSLAVLHQLLRNTTLFCDAVDIKFGIAKSFSHSLLVLGMTDSGTGTEEISDALKEQILLSILKNQFHQDVGASHEISEITETVANMAVADGQTRSGDHAEDAPRNREPTTSADRIEDPSREQSVKATEDSSVPEHRRNPPTAASGDQNANKSEIQETVAPGNQDQKHPGTTSTENVEKLNQEEARSDNQGEPLKPECGETQLDPMKQIEEELAAEEADLSPVQLKVWFRFN